MLYFLNYLLEPLQDVCCRIVSGANQHRILNFHVAGIFIVFIIAAIVKDCNVQH